MRKFRKALPSARWMAVVIAVSVVVGFMYVEGLRWQGLVGGLVLGLILIVLATIAGMDPDAWEQLHDPRAYGLRKERDEALQHLDAMLKACLSGSTADIQSTAAKARAFRKKGHPIRS